MFLLLFFSGHAKPFLTNNSLNILYRNCSPLNNFASQVIYKRSVFYFVYRDASLCFPLLTIMKVCGWHVNIWTEPMHRREFIKMFRKTGAFASVTGFLNTYLRKIKRPKERFIKPTALCNAINAKAVKKESYPRLSKNVLAEEFERGGWGDENRVESCAKFTQVITKVLLIQ